LSLSQLDLKQEVEALERLDLDLLRRRWRSLIGRPAPTHLARGLLLRILAYQQQIARLGDLDRETRIALGAQNDDAQHLASASDLDADKRRKAKAVKSVNPASGDSAGTRIWRRLASCHGDERRLLLEWTELPQLV